ncbi:hypothetical protein [Mycobacterium sp.]|uniref:DUF7159 family protein n=1 Tax=Mycobacterium sp. TaxID=1785 RepID=UPI003A848F85
MDTVLGLSVTPTTIGWVLAEGHGADGTILGSRELHLHDGRDPFPSGHGTSAVAMAERVAAEIQAARSLAVSTEHRLRVVGITWSDEASAQAALALEVLNDAGFDNVVPVPLLSAVEALAQAVAPIIGYEQAAVCILDSRSATVAVVDAHDGDVQSAVMGISGDYSDLASRLTAMFDDFGRRPGGVVAVGSQDTANDFSRQLKKVLPVPVFAQTMAQVTVARGAALEAAHSTEFTDAELVAAVAAPVPAVRRRSRQYAGAATALAAAAVTFVVSVSLAVGIQLAPGRDSGPSRDGSHEPPVAPVAEAAVTPAAPMPAGAVAPSPPVEHPATRKLRLSRALEHIPGTAAAPGVPPE